MFPPDLLAAMDKGTIDAARTERKGVTVTSTRTSRRSSSLAPLMAFLALAGGATFFGLLAVSGKSDQDVLSNTASVADSPRPREAKKVKTAPSVHPIASHIPTPPAPSLESDDPAAAEPRSASPLGSGDQARMDSALPRKPIVPVEQDVKLGELCNTSATQGRTSSGKLVICAPSPDDKRNHWQPA
jgi:hypothetical protein